MLKPETRIIAWDDCAFDTRQRKVMVVGAIFRGGSFLDGLISTYVKKDGIDSTEMISKAITSSRHYDQLSVIMTNGITFGGLNLVDIRKLAQKTGMPVIAVQRHIPNMEKFIAALKRTDKYRQKERIVRNAGEALLFGEIFYQKAGIANKEAEDILKMTCTRSKIPEPLRVAHLIASGLSRKRNGSRPPRSDEDVFTESKGRA